MSEFLDDDEPELMRGIGLRDDGRITGKYASPKAATAPEEVVLPLHLQKESKIELLRESKVSTTQPSVAVVATPTEQYVASRAAALRQRKSQRNFGVTVVFLFLFALVAMVGWYFYPLLRDKIRNANHGTITIYSEPSGAKIAIDGTEVGTTPYATDNLYTGNPQILLMAPGYRPYTGSFQGGREETIHAVLQKH